MLVELSVENFALIDRCRLEFGPGLNVLSGETGAGKSILVDAVVCAFGGRTSADTVRAGAGRAYVEAVFDLSALPEVRAAVAELGAGDPDDPTLVLSREVSAAGKSVARVNGRTVTAGAVRSVTERLIDLHGQHEHQSLLRPDAHLALLDAYLGEAHQPRLEAVARGARTVRELRARLKELSGTARERARELDLLAFQRDEIAAARLSPGEDERLFEEHRRLANAERLAQLAEAAYARLYEAGDGSGLVPVVDVVGEVLRELRDAAALDGSLAGVVEGLEGALVQVEDAARELRRYRDGIASDPGRLAEVEARLDLLHGLRRKYGDTVEEILAYAGRVEETISRLERAEEEAQRVEAELGRALRQLAADAAALSEARRAGAAGLEQEVVSVLAALGMPGARFGIAFSVQPDPDGLELPGGPRGEDRPVAFTERGADRVEFLFSANPGEPPRPLHRVASGGELSRVMLALRSVLAEADQVPSVIFDEIDAGVGGRTALNVARTLARLAERRQVLCVTHLAAIAAAADRHFAIEKTTEDGRTVTRVRLLDEAGRLAELARMLGAPEAGGVPLAHARELRARMRAAGGG